MTTPFALVGPVGRRVVAALRRSDKLVPRRPANIGDLLRLAYPTGIDDARRKAAGRLIKGDDPFDPTVARRMLGGFEQQVGAPRLLIRWALDDLELVDVAGSRLAIDRSDGSIGGDIRGGSYEPHVVAVLEPLLRAGATFVDVGANVGFHSVIAAAAVGPTGRVIAVEPNPENARLLAYTVALNELRQVEVLPIALSHERGYVSFTPMVGSNGGFATEDPDPLTSGRSYIVPTLRLDDLALARLDVLKVDVEGAEGMVMAGGSGTLERLRPAIVCEFSLEMLGRVSGVSGADYLGRFVALGYRVHVIDRDTHRAIPITSVAELLGSWGSSIRIEDLLLLPA